MATYRNEQLVKQMKVRGDHPEFFSYDKKPGKDRGKVHAYVLSNGHNNIYAPVREKALAYHRVNHIAWPRLDEPSGYLLDAKNARINHLFAMRDDEEAVLAIVQALFPDKDLIRVLPVECDEEPKFIAFDVIGEKDDYLKEPVCCRGGHCTSFDAVILAKNTRGRCYMITIDWKYADSYRPKDLSHEDYQWEQPGGNGYGKDRVARYERLIRGSRYLRQFDDLFGSPYFFEPFYDYMRQTLLAEMMIQNKQVECVKADAFLQVHVIPTANKQLFGRLYTFSGTPIQGYSLQQTWDYLCLKKEACVQVSPEDFMSPLANNKEYENLLNYLNLRYWQ